jgi:hypothetical protein
LTGLGKGGQKQPAERAAQALSASSAQSFEGELALAMDAFSDQRVGAAEVDPAERSIGGGAPEQQPVNASSLHG